MGHRGQAGRDTGTGGGGKTGGQGKEGRKPLQPEIQAVRCIPPGIQQMPAHHPHHHHQRIYNIDPDMRDWCNTTDHGPKHRVDPSHVFIEISNYS